MIRLFCRFGDIVSILLCNSQLNKMLMKHWMVTNVPLNTKRIVVEMEVCDVVFVLRVVVE